MCLTGSSKISGFKNEEAQLWESRQVPGKVQAGWTCRCCHGAERGREPCLDLKAQGAIASLAACPAGGQAGMGWALYSPPLGLPESKGVCV